MSRSTHESRAVPNQWPPSIARGVVLAAALSTLFFAAVASADLQVAIESDSSTWSVNSAPVSVTFRNSGPNSFELLDLFDPIPVFFGFQIVRSDGTPLQVPGAGKIHLGPADVIVLGAGETHTVELDIGSLLADAEIKSDSYTVSVTYQNQYGEGCFHGRVESNEVVVTIQGQE